MFFLGVFKMDHQEPDVTHLFALGFRAFFLLAGVAALMLPILWAQVYSGRWELNAYYGDFYWHGHEMLFGYTVAVIAGFLLTAVSNWTGQPTLTGAKLAGLCGLWLYGRLIPFYSGRLPAELIALSDLLFLPLLALALAFSLIRSGNLKNLVFILMLIVMAGANLAVHFEMLGVSEATAAFGIKLMLGTVIVMIAVIAGRIFPFFTERALPDASPVRRPLLDLICILSIIALWLVEAFWPSALWTGVLALAVAGLNGKRLAGWYTPGIWKVPLLWILYTGYGWIIVGFVLQAFTSFGKVSPFLTTHAYTVGGIGVLTLGMMARVSLGHTGRALACPRPILWAFVSMNLAVFARVLLPIALPQWYTGSILIATGLWVAAFALFVYVYAPILMRPRIDGRPG